MRKGIMGVVVAAGLSLAGAAQAESVAFNFQANAPTSETPAGPGLLRTYTYVDDNTGVSLTLSGQDTVNNTLVNTNVFRNAATGIGVANSGGGPQGSAGLVDGLNGNERLNLDFTPEVRLMYARFTNLNTNDTIVVRVGANGDIVYDGDPGSDVLNLNSVITTYNTRYSFSVGDSTDNYTLAEVGVNHTVPLPAAVWGGMGLLGALGGARLRRRFRDSGEL